MDKIITGVQCICPCTISRYAVVILSLLSLGGCGSLTGIPGHGGGKRFAVEQELVAAATRATIKKIDLSAIRGKKVNLFVNAIGDTGNGNLIGGRFSVVSQLRGDYIQTPRVVERSTYPRYTQTSSSSSTTSTSSRNMNTSSGVSTTSGGDNSSSSSSSSYGSGGSTSSSSTFSQGTTETVLPSPDETVSRQKGQGHEIQVGVEYKGLGAYQNSDRISSDDLQYLTGLFEMFLFLRGVHIVPPSEAEIDVYITVDVFGTVRTRVDWFLANNEILRAKTAIEVMAVNHDSGELVMAPQSASVEAEYNEQYILWAGPIMITKYLKKTEPLLTDFSDVKIRQGAVDYPEQDENIPYPFRHQIEKMMRDTELPASDALR